MKHRTILILFTILFTFSAYSRPARQGIIPLMQPDGTTFNARIRGDEFLRITTTTEGYAVVQDEMGWWCYAVFDNEGKRWSSGWRVGEDAPSPILYQSRNIPYDALSTAAGNKRSRLNIMTRPLDFSSLLTKDGQKMIKHGLVILAQYNDVRFRYDKQDFEDILYRDGYSYNGAKGSAKEYFDDQMNGMVEFLFSVSEIITLPDNREEYGRNTEKGEDADPARMVIEACKAADKDIDFSLYDDDGDGVIDNVFVIFAGGDEADGAGEDCIWSHAWYIYQGTGQKVMLDGVMLDKYACTSELSRRNYGGNVEDRLTGIGTFCHEYSHTFGLPDFYDTDYEGSGGRSSGLWIWTSLMDGGNQNDYGNRPPYFNAIEREILGICQPTSLVTDGTYHLGPINETNKAYRIDTDNKDEYYLLECRSGDGWDSNIGGRGLLIYHIDRSGRNSGYSDLFDKDLLAYERWTYANEVNCRPDHQCADLLEADGRKDGFQDSEMSDFERLYSDIKDIFFPHSGFETNPRFRFWSGADAEISISDIRWEDEGISFYFRGGSEADTPPEVASITVEAFPDAAIIQFESNEGFEGNAIVEWGRSGDRNNSVEVQSYSPGKFAVLIEGLAPGNKTYQVRISLEKNGIKGRSKVASFMTKKASSVTWPYIYMNGVEKNSDGTYPKGCRLPLRVCNASESSEIIWTFDGSQAVPDGDLYYRVDEDGELKARIIWKDGSEDTIIRKIIISKEE